MNVIAPKPMTVDEFLPWAQRQEFGRYELQDGRIVMQQAQTWGHADVRVRVYLSLQAAIARSSAPLFAAPDGMTVRIDMHTACEPDALVAALPKPDAEAVEIADPLVVVEVLSPGSRHRDLNEKAAAYAKIASIAHYLIIDPAGTILHHTRASMTAGGKPVSVTAPVLALPPLDVEIVVADVFGHESTP